MSSMLLRSIRYAACSFSALPSCSTWTATRLPSRHFGSSALLLRKDRTRKTHVEVPNVKKEKSKKKLVDIYEQMSVSELATSTGEAEDAIMEVLIEFHPEIIDNLSSSKILDQEHVLQIVSAFNCKPRLVSRPSNAEDEELKDIEPLPPPPESDLVRRPPVVTIMGHVDHGKTTLLDCLRNSRIVETEFGGITQHIGAFTLNDGKNSITFLDTPGHAAFAEMRQRGAQSTDIVVLVVAAEDGVMEQTVQSIRYAKEAGVPIVVAFNKCDKPTANVDKAKRSLLPYDIIVEDLHGDVLSADISALRGTNIGLLKDAILLQAEELNLKSTPKGPVEGIVIESTTVHGLGKACTMIVQRGTLKKGAHLVCGTSWAKVRLMTDERGREVKAAGPSTPVRVAGWKDTLPFPGERVNEVVGEQRARRIISYRMSQKMNKKAENDRAVTEGKRQEERRKYLENRQVLLNKGMRYGSTQRLVVDKGQRWQRDTGDEGSTLKLMLFSDVEGTLEAILNVLNTYSSQKVKMQIVAADVGPPSEVDIELAVETGALIYCFNVAMNDTIKKLAEDSSVAVESFNVIYRLVEKLKEQLSERMPDETELQIIGEGRILKEFLISDRNRKKRSVAGTLVQWGDFKQNCTFRFLRNGEVYYEGTAESMKCENEVVTSAKTGREVGIAMTDKTLRFKEGDSVIALEEVPVKKAIDWSPPGF